MTHSSHSNGCTCTCDTEPVGSPFLSVRYHFGMLLGKDDFDTEKNSHRGKMWLHNQWLHGAGVVWGFGVLMPRKDRAYQGEIRVRPGLALDALGRELHLDADACLNVASWFTDRRKKSPEETGWFT